MTDIAVFLLLVLAIAWAVVATALAIAWRDLALRAVSAGEELVAMLKEKTQ
jgi:hypothetical protein